LQQHLLGSLALADELRDPLADAADVW